MCTHNIISISKRKSPKLPKYNNVRSYRTFLLGTHNEFEMAVVNEPSVFESLKFYYTVKVHSVDI